MIVALVRIINYDHKLCSKLKCNLQSSIYNRKTFIVQATGHNDVKIIVVTLKSIVTGAVKLMWHNLPIEKAWLRQNTGMT